MKRSPAMPSKACNVLLGLVSFIHIVTGLIVIVCQIILIKNGSPFHDVGGGLWSGPVFFIQGVLGFVSLCDTLMCTIISYLISSIGSALLTVAVTAIAALDLGSIYKCKKDDHRLTYTPQYCSPIYASKITQASWAIVIAACVQLIASSCSVYICMRLIYHSDPQPTSHVSTPYLYDEIPSPRDTRFRGTLHNVQDRIEQIRKSSYSLNSTLPVRSKSVDIFSESAESSSDQNVGASTHSVNTVSAHSSRKKPNRIQNANSVHNVVYTSSRPTNSALRYPSTRSLNLNSESAGYLKHTAV